MGLWSQTARSLPSHPPWIITSGKDHSAPRAWTGGQWGGGSWGGSLFLLSFYTWQTVFLARHLELREDLYILGDILDMTIRNRNHWGHCKGTECNKRIYDLETAFENSGSYFCSLPKLHGLYLSVWLSVYLPTQPLQSTPHLSWWCLSSLRFCSITLLMRPQPFQIGPGRLWLHHTSRHILLISVPMAVTIPLFCNAKWKISLFQVGSRSQNSIC